MKELLNNFVELKEYDLRSFIIVPLGDYLIKYDDNYYIEKIIIQDNFILSIGDEVNIGDIKYTINIIRKEKEYFYFIQERITKTSQFILPLLGGSYEYYNFNNSFYNSYLSPDYKEIYLVFKFSNTGDYIKMEGELSQRPDFIEIIDPSPDIVVMKFSLPSVFYSDIYKIMKGRYSKINPTVKSKICTFHKFGVNSKTYKLLYKNIELRKEMEKEYGCFIPENVDLMSKPIKEKELWTFQDILKKDGIAI